MQLTANYDSMMGTDKISSYFGTIFIKKYFNKDNQFKSFSGVGVGFHLSRLTIPNVSIYPEYTIQAYAGLLRVAFRVYCNISFACSCKCNAKID